MEQETPQPDSEETPRVQIRQIGNRTFIVPELEPLDVDGSRTIAVGAGLWLLAFVMLLPFYGRLKENDQVWWLWTCIAGFGLGMFGWDVCRRRRKARKPPLGTH